MKQLDYLRVQCRCGSSLTLFRHHFHPEFPIAEASTGDMDGVKMHVEMRWVKSSRDDLCIPGWDLL